VRRDGRGLSRTLFMVQSPPESPGGMRPGRLVVVKKRKALSAALARHSGRDQMRRTRERGADGDATAGGLRSDAAAATVLVPNGPTTTPNAGADRVLKSARTAATTSLTATWVSQQSCCLADRVTTTVEVEVMCEAWWLRCGFASATAARSGIGAKHHVAQAAATVGAPDRATTIKAAMPGEFQALTMAVYRARIIG
jgi:hypothetical protein